MSVYCTIPNSVISIELWAFYNTGLTSIMIPNSVTNINRSFERCSNLISIDVDSNNMAYASEDGVLFNKSKTLLIRYPIGKTDTNYVIPDGVISIVINAFENCVGLTSVTIGNNVTNIGGWAFSGCSNLASVTIGNSVTTIGDFAFVNCISLISIIAYPTIPPVFAVDPFYGIPYTIPVYIPCFTYNSYRNASGWRSFTNFIIDGAVTPDTTFYNDTICYGSFYTDNNFTIPIYQAGTYYATLANTANCDSIICLTLAEYPQHTNYYSATICQGDVYNDSNFANLTQSGTYYHRIPYVNDCDSVIE